MRDRLGSAGRVGEFAAWLLLVVAALGGVVSEAHAGAAPPQFDIQKLVNGVDADVASGVIVPVGSTVTFTYELRLQSAANLMVSVDPINDDNGTPGFTGDDFSPAFISGDISPNGLLDVGEVWLYSHNATASLGLVTNLATVTVRDALGGSATDSDPANYTGVATVPSPMPLLLLLSGLIPVAVVRAHRSRRTA